MNTGANSYDYNSKYHSANHGWIIKDAGTTGAGVHLLAGSTPAAGCISPRLSGHRPVTQDEPEPKSNKDHASKTF